MISIRRKLMAKIQSEPGILPDGYTQLKYIEASGHQYIVTDVQLTDKTDIVRATMAFTRGNITDGPIIYAGNSSTWCIGVGSLSRQSPYTSRPLQCYLGTTNNVHGSVGLNTFTTVSVNVNTRIMTVDGTEYSCNYRNVYNVDNSYYNIFRVHQGQNYTYATSAKTQEAEVVGKGLFIPCIRKADGEIGVFNITTQTFLGNAGTGTFGYETMGGTYVAPV